MRAVIREFDKIKDLAEVDQFGFVNLPQAYVSGSIDGHINPDISAMNNIEEPESIIGRPSDEFDAIALQQVIRERGKKSSNESAPAPDPAPSGAE